MGFSREVVDWYKLYLSSREFHVTVHDKFFTSADLRCVVPQGSIPGPLLFLFYVNDMPQAVDCDLFLYAVDICLLFQHKDLEWIKEELTKNFSNILDWFVDNKWSIRFGVGLKLNLFLYQNQKKENWNVGHTIWQCQNQAILKSNIFRLWVRRELVGEGYGFEIRLNKINGRLKFLYRITDI